MAVGSRPIERATSCARAAWASRRCASGSWPLWALVVIGAGAVLTNQRAYQATLMSVTTPVLNIAQVMVAIGFGVVIFGEDPGSTLPVVAGEVLGLAVILLSVGKLAAGSRQATA